MAVRKPKAPVPEQQATGAWDDARTGVYAENLAHGYRQSSTVARNLGHQFYPSWHQDAVHFGERSGTSTEHGAVALARFSPQTHEAMNRMQALQLLHVDDKQEHHIRTALEHRQLATYATKAGDMDEAAYHDAQAKHHRVLAKLPGTPLNNQSSNTLATALDVRNNVYPHPLRTLDGKIGDYAGAIHDPTGYQRIAGDTHIYHAAVGGGNHAIAYEDTGGLFQRPKVYEGLQQVHHLAYASNIEAGHVDPAVTPPNAHMGTIWFDHRDRKIGVNPDAAKSAKARDSQVTRLLAHPLGGQWDPARQGLRPLR